MKTNRSTDPIPGRVRQAAALLTLAGALLAAPAVVAATEPTLAEMLELGIYSEETKGDLAAATKLYEQIVAEAAADQAVAAQAQFRLGMCLHKQKDFAGATAALEKLVRDHPGQTELVALANAYLADGIALLPVPWQDREQLLFDVKLGTGLKIGSRQFNVESATVDGRKVWRFVSNMIHNLHAFSRVEVDAETFRPIQSHWEILPLGVADTRYTETGATVTMPGQSEPKHTDLSGAYYDNEQAVQLMRRLPLAPGYKTELKIFVGLGGGRVLPFEIEVAAVETLTVPAGTFECYKLTSNIGQTFWYSTGGARVPVKFEEGGASIELAAISHRAASEAQRYQDDAYGFAFEVPGPWLVARKGDSGSPRRNSSVIVLDDGGVAIAQVKVEPVDQVDEAARASARALADHRIAGGPKYVKDFRVREDSWREISIAGQPAWSVVFDGEQNNKRIATRCVYAIVNGRAVDIWAATSPEDFDGFQPQFDAFLATFRMD